MTGSRLPRCERRVKHKRPGATNLQLRTGHHQDRVQGVLPCVVESAEPTVLVALGVGGLVLQPQELQGDSGTPELLVDMAPIGNRPGLDAGMRYGRIEQSLQGAVAQPLGQGPAQPHLLRSQADARNRGPAAAHHSRDLPVRQPLGPESKHFSDLSHGQPFRRHSSSWFRGNTRGTNDGQKKRLSSVSFAYRVAEDPIILKGGPHALERAARITRNRWPTSVGMGGPHRLEQVARFPWKEWPSSSGIRISACQHSCRTSRDPSVAKGFRLPCQGP
jgi:hypothetical protein